MSNRRASESASMSSEDLTVTKPREPVVACKQKRPLIPMLPCLSKCCMTITNCFLILISLILLTLGILLLVGVHLGQKKVDEMEQKMDDRVDRNSGTLNAPQKERVHRSKKSIVLIFELIIVRIKKILTIVAILLITISLFTIVSVICCCCMFCLRLQIVFYVFLIVIAILGLLYFIFGGILFSYNFQKIARIIFDDITKNFHISKCPLCAYNASNFNSSRERDQDKLTYSDQVIMLMSMMKCCGFKDYRDIEAGAILTRVPPMCCNTSTDNKPRENAESCPRDQIFPGCFSKFEWMKPNVDLVIFLIALFLILIAVLHMILPAIMGPQTAIYLHRSK